MAEGRRYVLNPQLDIAQILLEAKSRWLRPSEVCEILRNYQKFHLTPDPPYKPSGGSLFLFDRKALRYFRKDGHRWRKKKDGKTVREAHEKLKSGSVDVLHCYYAHGEDNENFQRRSYWMLDGQLEHIVLVHYRDVNEGGRPSIPNLLNTDPGTLSHTQGAQASSAHCSAHLSTSIATHASYASSPSTADWNGHTPSSEFEDADSGDDFGASSLADSISYSGLQISSLPAKDLADNTLSGCSRSISHPYASGSIDTAGLSGPSDPFYANQVFSQNLIQSNDQQKNVGTSQGAGLFGRACFSHHSTSPTWPDILNINQNISGMQEQKISFDQPICSNVTRKLADSMLARCGVMKYGVDGGYKFLPDAHMQTYVGDGVTVQVKKENAENVDSCHDKRTVVDASHIHKAPHEHQFHIAHPFENNSGSELNTAIDQSPEFETKVSHALQNDTVSNVPNDEEGGLKKLDSFGRWMNKEIGRDCDDSLMASDSGNYWNTLETQNDDKEVSSLSRHMQLDIDSLGPSLSQEQLFSILDFSPDWAYSGIETKVLIVGTFLGGVKTSSIKWCCMFGEQEVSAEVLTTNTIRCLAPAHTPGRVPFYITCSDRLACSEVREFEYRENLSGTTFSFAQKSEPEDEIHSQVRFAKMISVGASRKRQVCTVENCHKCNLKNDLSFMLSDDENEWDKIEKDSKAFQGYHRNPKDVLIQKLLKGRLSEWLVCRAHEEGKGPNVLDEEGQGVIHLAAALGYEWAMSPIVAAGVNPSFRDAHGRTGLHWAAYFGREETVVALIRLGAAPGAVDDPTSKFPEGQTAADLASSRGHKGIAGYLAEADLTSHLSSLTVKESVMNSVSANLAAEKAIETVQEQNIVPLVCDKGEQLSLRGSLAAVRNSAQAAARIQAVFRVHSFRQRQLTKSNDENSDIPDEVMIVSSLNNKSQKIAHFNDSLHTAAVKIQQKYRGWKGRREFLKIRNRIVKIQAHVRGHQVRKQYKKVVWSVGIVEKAILRWRRRGTGLRGFRAEKTMGGVELEMGKTDEYDYLRVGRKQKVANVEKALARVRSMVRYPEARDQYMRLVAGSQKSKLGDEGQPVQDGSSEVGSKVEDDLLAPMMH